MKDNFAYKYYPYLCFSGKMTETTDFTTLYKELRQEALGELIECHLLKNRLDIVQKLTRLSSIDGGIKGLKTALNAPLGEEK